MNEQSKVALATVIGAAVGGVVGCLYLTQRGRHTREQIEPFLDNFIGEMHHLRSTAEKIRKATEAGRRSLDDLLGEDDPSFRWRASEVRKASG